VLSGLADSDLLRLEREMRIKAWHAPKALMGDVDNPMIVSTGDAYARFGTEWCKLHRECLRRGLPPSTSDPNFRPQTATD
jgi:hypothetical protein